MHVVRRRRLTWVLAIVCGVSIALGLILFALKQNINFFFSPTQVALGEAPPQHVFRLGGLIKVGSVARDPRDNLLVNFIVTDNAHEVKVHYRGILPDLFKPGRDVVAEGHLNPQGEFVANQVLAKHDNNYMPPEVRKALQMAKKS